jgi:hypothetical protein
MSIGNKAELVQAVSNYTHRSDLTGVIPDFIALAEARFNRILRTAEMEKRAKATITSEYLSWPLDMIELRNIQTNQSPVRFLQYRTPQQMDEQIGGAAGTPCFFTIIGKQIQFSPVTAGPLEIEIAYYQRVPALTDLAPTNWLLTAHPDAYLYGTLIQSEAYGYKDARLAIWKSGYDEAIGEVMSLDERKRWSGGTLTMQGLGTV